MSAKQEIPGALSIQNTKLAASLHSLGFVNWTADAIQPENGGPMVINFLFRGGSIRPEFAGSVMLGHAKALLNGQLEKLQPMHPLCVAMRGQHNHDMLAEAASRKVSIRLAGVAGGAMTRYIHGVLDSHFLRPEIETVTVDDLDLAAALGGVGLPVVRIEGTYPHFRFHVARFGYALQAGPAAPAVLEDASRLSVRSPTKDDPLRLALELENPMHPVCIMYEALFSRANFKRDLERVTPLLLLNGGAKLQALVTMNATGRVMQAATRHLKSPPIPWDS